MDSGGKVEHANVDQLGTTLLDYAQQKRTIGELTERKTTMLIFVRHFNCYVCRDQVKALSRMDQNQLRERNMQVIVRVIVIIGDRVLEGGSDSGVCTRHWLPERVYLREPLARRIQGLRDEDSVVVF